MAVSKIAVKMGDRVLTTCTNILAQPTIYSSVQGRLLGKMTEFEQASVTIVEFGEYIRSEVSKGIEAQKTEISTCVATYQEYEKKLNARYKEALMVGIQNEIDTKERVRNERVEQPVRVQPNKELKVNNDFLLLEKLSLEMNSVEIRKWQQARADFSKSNAFI